MSWGWNSKRKRNEKAILAKKQDYRCWLCGTRRSIRTFTLDHVKPRRFNGQDKRSNLKLACGSCNHNRGGAVNRLMQPGFYRRDAYKKFENLIIDEHVKNLRRKKQ
jgi:5-methylcytosine-specific restriction endonuclease McrA